MDLERERIRADLRGILDGEIRCDDTFLELYSTDASIYQVKPLAVVRPRRTSDVSATVQYAAENQIPIHARGAGTGMAGESLGTGIVIDFAHSMRRILETGDDWVRVQPGVVLANLNRHLAQRGSIFGPDPATRSVTTMGSVIALDASGSHWPQHGSARDHILELQAVLANGEVVTIKPTHLDRVAHLESPELVRITSGVAELMETNADKIQGHLPKTFNQGSGYRLSGVLNDDQIDLCKILSGSEGSLALVTQAKLRTSPRAKARGLVLLFFERLDSAAKAAVQLASSGISACDLLDRRILAIARETDPRYSNLIPENTEAMLLVEFSGETQTIVHDELEKIADRIRRRRRLAFHSLITTSPKEVGTYWELARRMTPILYRLKGNTRPLPFIEDMTVPPPQMPNFLSKLQDVLKRHETIASIFAHAAHGHLHVRPLLNMADPADLAKLERIADETYEELFQLGGSLSGECGDGLSRTPYLPRQYGPLYDLFGRIKRLFDPSGIMNPGKKVFSSTFSPMELVRRVELVIPAGGSDSNGKSDDGTKATSKNKSNKNEFELPILTWTPEEMATEARSCHGCGRCRTYGADTRMCPVFRFDSREDASPRAKANLLRGVLAGQLPPESLDSQETKSILDTCFHCHQCRIDCPSNVDIPNMVLEMKARNVDANGLTQDGSLQAKIHRWAVWGNRFPRIANWALGNRVMRWLMERFIGLAKQRKLPRLANRSFVKQAARRGLTTASRRSGRKVLYFVDLYANLFDTQLAQAFVNVLDHNRIAVYVHPKQQVSGMPSISQGAVTMAARLAHKNVKALAEAVRQGYTIVATEPSAVMALTHEYPKLLDSDDAKIVAENTREACEFLWDLHHHGELELDLKPVNLTVGFHVPCHLRALHEHSYGQRILQLIPGLSVRSIEKGCSGMAGTFGLTRENFRSSLRIGWDLVVAMRAKQIQIGSTECSACKMQMEQAGNKAVVHPIKLLAKSYGILEQETDLFSPSAHELFVT
ncbi:anaerobic glycerol-3-phosphate dehydrogenase subunit C [Bremerella sp. T1]|uniref:anaerobic glycerol-3-phosphate dehydrogenase subunit C n=1 Tax=Bremerella sp. TYQ1 TaxID=3119568 RepID=UPI001CCB3972|nr:anaerobic glycerol-3-phosphate dehydrogenase subunit C [Bremerella volcania]UBM36302.1 anaerobic glycerol-3-phosphate dehydrogenase subunit C [Bremerella volcania]